MAPRQPDAQPWPPSQPSGPGWPEGAVPAEHAPYAPPRQDQAPTAYGQYPGGQRSTGPADPGAYGQPMPGQPPYGQHAYGQPAYGQQPGAWQQPAQPPVNAGQYAQPTQPPAGYGGAAPQRRWSSGPPVPPVVRKRRGSILPSLFFGILALILAGTAVYLYIQQNEDKTNVAPTARPGQNGLAQVVDTFNGAGLKTEYAPSTAKYDAFDDPGTPPTPGQSITVDGNQAWVFVYPSADEQQADAQKWDAGNPGAVTSPSGKQLTTAKPVMYAHSNVIVVVSTDKKPSSDELSKIEQAVNTLP